MSGVHKYPTISFRISSREREEIEAKILASRVFLMTVRMCPNFDGSNNPFLVTQKPPVILLPVKR